MSDGPSITALFIFIVPSLISALAVSLSYLNPSFPKSGPFPLKRSPKLSMAKNLAMLPYFSTHPSLEVRSMVP